VPLDRSELIARIAALIRRSRVYCSEFTSIYLVKELRIDLGNKTLSRRGKLIRLPPREFQLLEYLVIRRSRTVKRSDIL
jgi:two-component system OmpR family response regulator